MKDVTLTYEEFNFLIHFAWSGWHADVSSGFYDRADGDKIEELAAKAGITLG